MKDHVKQKRVQEQQWAGEQTLTLENLISALKDRLPELRKSILALEEDESLTKDAEFEQFVFSFVFNPFFKKFLSDPSDVKMGERLFLFLEEMAQSSDLRVKHMLAVTLFGALMPDELAVAEQYIGPQTNLCRASIWNREALKERMRKERINLTCWGYGKEAVRELEWKLNVAFDVTTRSFIEEIGNITLYSTLGRGDLFLNQTGVSIVTVEMVEHAHLLTYKIRQANDSLRQSMPTDKVMAIMRFAGLDYFLQKDGSVKAYENVSSSQVVEHYISLAHLLEELIKNMQVSGILAESYRALTKQKRKSLIRRHRPQLTLQQKDIFLKRIDKEQESQQDTINLEEIIHERLPELPETLDDWGYAFGWADYAAEHDYYQELFDEVLTPFIILFLNQDPGDVIITRHLFNIFERMTENSYSKRKLALTVFDSLSAEQLKVAKKYMKSKTKKLLDEFEDYFEELFKKK